MADPSENAAGDGDKFAAPTSVTIGVRWSKFRTSIWRQHKR